MVHAQPEQAGDGLGAEHVRRLEACVARCETDRPRRGKQAGGRDELRVELAHRHDARRIGGRPVLLAQGDDRACSSSRVSGSSGLNATTLGPITPARTTEAICGAAQLGAEDCFAALRSPPAPGRPRRPSPSPSARRGSPRARTAAVCHHPYLPLSDGDSEALIAVLRMPTESEHSPGRPLG
jgi:hypothetical protein